MDTPGVWSKIDLNHYDSPPRLRLYLERSCQVPLTTELESYGRKILDVVMPHVNQISFSAVPVSDRRVTG